MYGILQRFFEPHHNPMAEEILVRIFWPSPDLLCKFYVSIKFIFVNGSETKASSKNQNWSKGDLIS